jgi:hypothetical protein
MANTRSIVYIAALALCVPAAARAGLVFGGGPAKSDCYAAFDVAGVTSAKGDRVVQCRDGDPCDTDGQQNGTCSFSFMVCVLQSGDPTCQPPDVDKIRKRGISVPSTPTTVAGCGGANTANVKVNKHRPSAWWRTERQAAPGPRRPPAPVKKPVPSPPAPSSIRFRNSSRASAAACLFRLRHACRAGSAGRGTPPALSAAA